jgi:hypothetical protein
MRTARTEQVVSCGIVPANREKVSGIYGDTVEFVKGNEKGLKVFEYEERGQIR